jgi:lipopolysaccharide/colanic/teichoic acid biosynthesis glycosyltransferase
LLKPGITGWAQINYRYTAGEAESLEKLRYDLYYLKHGGLVMDLRILLRTVGEIMKGSR